MKTNEEILNLKFKICDNVEYLIDKNGIVTLLEKQDHKIQNILRKLKFKIPMYKEIELDEYCSTIFIMLNGKNTVEELGQNLELKYGEKVHPLYERLLLFINHIYADCKYVEITN
ncbi:PqqD family peptide modification chaperone [Terrisporobacter vanillatitrophus]|uniref:PqqD family peptide modification chaperone n=1 Tax=Terrisporobacter vanillatitrophus TaxID=3058402 RepID=UPI0033671E58